MSDYIEIKGLEETEARLRALAASTLPASLEHSIAVAGQTTLRVLKTRMRGTPRMDAFWGRGGVTEDGHLGRRRGWTVNRMSGGHVLKAGNTLFTTVGSPDKYMKAQEDGGTLTTGKWFRIPTAAMQTSVGVDFNAGRSVKGMANTRLVRTKKGKLWIVLDGKLGSHGVTMKGRATTFLYLLTKRIKLKGKHVFAETRKETEPVVTQATMGAVALAVREANRG